MTWIIYNDNLNIKSGLYVVAIKGNLILEDPHYDHNNYRHHHIRGALPILCYFFEQVNEWHLANPSIDTMQMIVPSEKILCFYEIKLPELPESIGVKLAS